KSVPNFTEDSVRELRVEAQREGMQGISPRYIQDKLSNALVSEQALQENPTVPVLISLAAPSSVSLVDATLADVQQNVANRQRRVLSDLPESQLTVTHQYRSIAALGGTVTKAGLDALNQHPDVVAIALDGPGFISGGLAQSVALVRANDAEFASLGLDGTGITVAVLDSGIDTDHVDLADNLVGERCFITNAPPPQPQRYCPDDPNHPNFDPAHPAEDDMDPAYHGTHISGIITSNGNVAPRGVATNAAIFAYKILDSVNFGSGVDIANAFDDIVGEHLMDFDFINMSIKDGAPWPAGTCSPFNTSIDDALILLRAAGTLAFAISGNNGAKDGISWPACVPVVVSVGAVYDNNLGPRNWKPGGVPLCKDPITAADMVACFSQSSDDLELLAPGALIESASANLAGFLELSGTSQAAPHAVGVAALLKQMLPGITPGEIEQVLKDTGIPVKDHFDPSNIRTTPRVDARAAVLDHDFDGDGCSNGREAGGDEHRGGLRDPEDPWDYYDVSIPRDGFIDLPNDILGVILHFAPGGYPPGDETFDRGPKTGPYDWNMTAPDGVIDLPNDILGVILQFQHNCI
ncbi:MAG: S8 family serine peptidase, partial [Chloroflexi bacterium]|nr:S8 family serine peptidase [Chloroflexota bacterium]